MARHVLCCSGSLDGGGSERQLWQLATGLDPQRFAAEIYVLYRRGDYLTRVPERIPIHDFWSSHSALSARWPGWIRREQIRDLAAVIRRRKIDCVYDRTFHMTLLTAAACQQTRTPRVSVIVSPPSQDFVQSRERFRWFKKRLLAAAYRDATCCPVAVSEAVADDAADFYKVPRSRFETIPSPIDIAAVEQASLQPTAATLAIPLADPGALNIAVVGRLSSEKGQALAISAVAEIQRLRPSQTACLTLVGDGPDRAELERFVQRVGLNRCVRFVGQQANPYPWIRASDLICIPSKYEGLPNVALEAMCLGTPLLASECGGGIRELLGNRERGMLVPADPRALAIAMLDRHDAAEAWQARARVARVWVRAHHGLQPWLERMQQLFDQRIDSRKQRDSP